jgi:hypothetical protein
MEWEVFEEGSTFRGKLKTEARQIARSHYQVNPTRQICGQAEYRQEIQANVDALLSAGEFMKGANDDNVSNFLIRGSRSRSY